MPSRGPADYLDLGNWNVVCYRCGWKRKATQMRKQWQGYWVCPEHWEARQPQDFVRAPADLENPPWTQPLPAPIFVYFCSLNGRSGLVGWGVVGCMIVGGTTPVDTSITPGE